MSQTMSMKTTNIPDTRLNPSRVALGTWAIGGWMWGGTDDAQAIATIKSALDRGITLIDTAPAYGFGHAEELVGQALAEAGARDKVSIATKVGLDWNPPRFVRSSKTVHALCCMNMNLLMD
jgi:aryl-alcohol dehydrogenase-like predicted oxidoreductase